jgi:hypothetical protein
MLVNTPLDSIALIITLKDKKMNSCSSFTFSCLDYTIAHDRISKQRISWWLADRASYYVYNLSQFPT